MYQFAFRMASSLRTLSKGELVDYLLDQRFMRIFISGKPGSGKTFIIRHLACKLRELGRKVLITASTGVSAQLLDGNTLHSILGIGNSKIEGPTDFARVFLKCMKNGILIIKNFDFLFIDEISMIPAAIFDFMIYSLRRLDLFDKIQLIFSGDFLQLPPVKGKKFAFEGIEWTNIQPVMLYLNSQFRTRDTLLLKILDEVRYGLVSQETIECISQLQIINPLTPCFKLFCVNSLVDEYNETLLNSIATPSIEFNAKTVFFNRTTEIIRSAATEFRYSTKLLLKVSICLKFNFINCFHRGWSTCFLFKEQQLTWNF